MSPVLVTLGAVTIGFGLWLFIVRRYDRIEPESLRSLLGAAVLGGGGAFLLAGLANEALSSATGLHLDFSDPGRSVPLWKTALFCGFVGLNEEFWKVVASYVGTRRLKFVDEPVDAMIFAMTVALGFAAAENLAYAHAYGNEVLLVRFLWPVPAHMAYAAVWGYGLARARFGVRGRIPPLRHPRAVRAGRRHPARGGQLHARHPEPAHAAPQPRGTRRARVSGALPVAQARRRESVSGTRRVPGLPQPQPAGPALLPLLRHPAARVGRVPHASLRVLARSEAGLLVVRHSWFDVREEAPSAGFV